MNYVLRSYHDKIVQSLKNKLREEREEKFRYKARAEYFEAMASARKQGECLPKKTIDSITRGRMGECGFSEARMDVTLRGQKRSNKWTTEGKESNLIIYYILCLLSLFLLPSV